MSKNNSFTLPPLSGQAKTVTTSTSSSGLPNKTITQVQNSTITQPTSKDFIFGGIILLILAIIFFVAAQQFSNHLVKKKHKPSSANTSAIWLFLLLFDLAVIAVVGIFDVGILSLLQLSIPLAVLALVFLILLALSSRK